MKTRRPNDSSLDKCPFHLAVLQACNDALAAQSFFSKVNILKSLGYDGIASAISWEYIRRRIENPVTGQGVQLLPVSSLFFKRHKKGHPLNSLLAGPGGKSAGFCFATFNHGEIALLNGTMRRNQGVGMFNKSRDRAQEIAQQLFTQGDGEQANRLLGTYGLSPLLGKDSEAA